MVLADELRQAVLQAALQGKLTEQLDTDSNVDETLIGIQEEKKKLIADKKIKKEKSLPEILDEEIPFDIPDNWRWVRLGDVVKTISAGGDKPSNFSKEKTELFSVPVIANGETNNGILGYTNKAIIKEESLTVSGRGTIGFSVVRTEPYVPIVRLLVITPLKQTNLPYIQCVLKSLVEIGIGTAVKQLTVPMIQPKIIPFPPIEEQQRIVDKINEIMPKIDEYEKIEKELETLKKEFPTKMKDALLQAAMQGKLTEPSESDSSVDELLEAIKKEKEKLIAQKKIRKEKTLPDIEEEEFPFAIPENWRWEKLGNLFHIERGASPRPITAYITSASDGINWIKIGDTEVGGKYVESTKEKITKEGAKESRAVKAGDFIFSNSMSFGRPYIVNIDGCIHDGWNVIHNINSVNNDVKEFNQDYLYFVLSSSVLKQQIVNKAEGGVVKNIKSDSLRDLIIPIPPIEEQQRIVERLDALLPLCEDLKEN